MNPFCELVLAIFGFIMLCIIIAADKDENNMDSYDRMMGIAGEGRTRGVFGAIYKQNGEYDFWANLFDSNSAWWYD